MVSTVTYQQCGHTWYQPRFSGTSTTMWCERTVGYEKGAGHSQSELVSQGSGFIPALMRSTSRFQVEGLGVLAVALAMVSACGKSADTELFTNGGDGYATDGGTDASITTGGAMGDGSSRSETGSSNNGSIDATSERKRQRRGLLTGNRGGRRRWSDNRRR